MKNLYLASAAGLALLGLSQAAHAQDQDAQQTGEAASQGLQDIVVTARRSSESLQSVPVAVTALSGAVIGLRGTVKALTYDLFAGQPVRKPEFFITDRTTAGFNLTLSF